MNDETSFCSFTNLAIALLYCITVQAQEIPKQYPEVLRILGKTGDYSANVLKANLPRNDLSAQIAGRATPTPFGFGGWLAMTRCPDGTDVMMGDLVLTQEEVNPVMLALLEHGLDVTALHNHFFYEQPRLFYGLNVVAIHHHMLGTQPTIIFLHYWGRGPAEKLAEGFRAAMNSLAR